MAALAKRALSVERRHRPAGTLALSFFASYASGPYLPLLDLANSTPGEAAIQGSGGQALSGPNTGVLELQGLADLPTAPLLATALAGPASMRLGVGTSPSTISGGPVSQPMEAMPVPWAGLASLLLGGPVRSKAATASTRLGARDPLRAMGALESTPRASAVRQ
jgi:hypothetical protein